jgi:hypothetical protein
MPIREEALYHLLFENSMDAILLPSSGGNSLATNPVACLMVVDLGTESWLREEAL